MKMKKTVWEIECFHPNKKTLSIDEQVQVSVGSDSFLGDHCTALTLHCTVCTQSLGVWDKSSASQL
jgi:hypothetical protein